ncbi:hypothetical protein LMJF_23_0420 [Leishmania major strain Friedlin]|uniref:Uncharacterized protein n=1 Tax=Leishmania major TaxID=5664 RepID=Q4QBD2_LEIMA|nr:hypothetical protein LMJF_23_0420 [Leishmania major strain Friedlin]CAG9574156.1 hypothetical_protein_-_conserved [Leishmania major strain Friedlin]CAJ04096.1 hypothetical protein LMJF_23_0420 [Leishmania major strain Friedlin]|eukprot:XP_001683366.1 hypothetical protein LMJF_23_0420 [Leishmania major strain Friedlin]
MHASILASMYTKRDVSVSSDSALSGPSSCCVSSLSPSSSLSASAHRRGHGAPPPPLQHFFVPEPRGLAQETSCALSFAGIGGLAGALLALLRTTEYDMYHVQCVATEVMANLQVVRLHLIERTLNATVGMEEACPSQEDS